MRYVIFLIPGNEIRICKFIIDGRDGDVNGMMIVDGGDGDVGGMLIGSKLIAEAMKRTYFDAKRIFLRNCESTGKIIVLTARKFVAEALVLLICQSIYKFLDSLFLKDLTGLVRYGILLAVKTR
eukprot:Gb_35261 [translate_table: standard]